MSAVLSNNKGLIFFAEHGVADGDLGDTINLTPPFILKESVADEIVHLLEETVTEVQKQL
jgi:adenosylmethionine-8-amino-7-oxononanoate aminotransferase